MFQVYQDSIGTQRFKSFSKAEKYLLDTIKESFSFVEVCGDEDDDDYKEIEYDIKVSLTVSKQ